MWERIRHMLAKEFIQVFRDPRMRVVIFATPIIQLLVIGYAVTTDVTRIATVVADLDRTQDSREVVRRFEGSGYFRVVRSVTEARAIQTLMDEGAVKAALQFDPGFADDLARGRTATMQVIVDGTDSNTASVVLAYATRIIAQINREHIRATLAQRRGAGGGRVVPEAEVPGVDLRSRAW